MEICTHIFRGTGKITDVFDENSQFNVRRKVYHSKDYIRLGEDIYSKAEHIFHTPIICVVWDRNYYKKMPIFEEVKLHEGLIRKKSTPAAEQKYGRMTLA